MQKILLLSLIFISVNLTGQTITSDWFFQPGDSFDFIESTNPTSVDLPKSGVDRIWDFSTLEGNMGGTNEYVDPTAMTQASFFPDATTATGLIGLIEVYYQATDDTLSVTGLYLNLGAEVWVDYNENQGEILGAAPMMLGDTLRHTVEGIVTDGINQQPLTVPQQLSFEGLGTVYIPGDTIINTAYIKSEVFDQDGLTTTIVHLLFKNSFTNPIVQVSEQFDPATGVEERTILWQSNFVGDITSTNEDDRLDFVVNADAIGNVNILADEEVDANIQLINMNGQVLQTTSQILQRGVNQLDFTQVANSGQYIVFILDKESGQFYTHQVMIAK